MALSPAGRSGKSARRRAGSRRPSAPGRMGPASHRLALVFPFPPLRSPMPTQRLPLLPHLRFPQQERRETTRQRRQKSVLYRPLPARLRGTGVSRRVDRRRLCLYRSSLRCSLALALSAPHTGSPPITASQRTGNTEP